MVQAEEHRFFNPHSFLSLVGPSGGIKHMQLQKSWIKVRRNRDTETKTERDRENMSPYRVWDGVWETRQNSG